MANLIPQPCQLIAANIESTTKRLEALQKRLQSASTPEKAGIVRVIANLEFKLEALEAQLSACVLAHTPHPGFDPWARTLSVPIVSFTLALNSFLSNIHLRLHNIGSGDHRHSTLDVQRKDSRGNYASLSGFPQDIGQLSSTTDYHFNDINSSSITLRADTNATPPMRLDVLFETKDEEIIVNNWFNKDFTVLTVALDGDLGVDAARGLLALIPSNVKTKAVVSHWYGDSEDGSSESSFNQKIASQLAAAALQINTALTNQVVATDRLNFDYRVLAVRRQGDNWEINFRQTLKNIVFQP